ncbi:DNA-binding transcriptional regulator KdgR [Volucribacter amazonae]|uniref:DNA-binding transcriptional regulator KdgR n=1 Tax=Volucribacter amazonae TaxID=256731 RepID=A0A9X4SQS9_9PAST|nr:DNA-binding transcriptional regulator KdgR [Volucribacter amazonae]MDG6895721.1 DNA-binding transcriptional regulator KdgR [Volucribacter amazonae]
MEKNTQPDNVAAVLKVFNILDILAEQKEIGITDLATKLMMSKSTTYRFLQTMKNLGFVQQTDDTEKYGLTLKLFELGSKALEYTDLIELAHQAMNQIAKQTNETLHLGTLDGQEIIYLHKIDSNYNLRMYSRIGRRNPAYSTAIGKILLSQYSNQEVADKLKGVEFIPHTAHTLTNMTQLQQELEQVRLQHYAMDNEEQEQGLKCIAVPIYDRFGSIIAGISISLPTVRFDQAQLSDLVKQLHQAGKTVSQQLGYQHYPV